MVNLAVMLGAVFFDGLGGWICDCRLRDVGAFINIQLSNTTFSMSVYDVLLPLTDGFGKPVSFSGGGAACAVTFSTSEFTGYNVLGFNFLQNLYTSFDVDSKEVSLAKLRKGALQSSSYQPNIIPLRGPLGKHMNATTVIQPDIEYTYGIPQFNTTKYPTAGGDRSNGARHIRGNHCSWCFCHRWTAAYRFRTFHYAGQCFFDVFEARSIDSVVWYAGLGVSDDFQRPS